MSLGRLSAQGKLIPCRQHKEKKKRKNCIPARFFVTEHEAMQQITMSYFCLIVPKFCQKKYLITAGSMYQK